MDLWAVRNRAVMSNEFVYPKPHKTLVFNPQPYLKAFSFTVFIQHWSCCYLLPLIHKAEEEESYSVRKMVSKRQKLARKRYKEANPELFPKPEPTPPKDPNKKKKKSTFKKKKGESKDPNKKRSFTKHPFRVAGMKPGESCFICKEHDHIARDCPRKAEWEKNKICLLCRRRGHSLKNCPNKNDEVVDKKLCYNCGNTSHSLANCPYPLQDGGTKFASCFICKEQGHLSKDCPKNTHGIYPKGGCCKICGGVTHLARDCPNKSGKASDAAIGRFKISQFENRPRGQVTKLSSGDDLEDDFNFMAEDVNEDDDAKLKKKKEPKVVNFEG